MKRAIAWAILGVAGCAVVAVASEVLLPWCKALVARDPAAWYGLRVLGAVVIVFGVSWAVNVLFLDDDDERPFYF